MHLLVQLNPPVEPEPQAFILKCTILPLFCTDPLIEMAPTIDQCPAVVSHIEKKQAGKPSAGVLQVLQRGWRRRVSRVHGAYIQVYK